TSFDIGQAKTDKNAYTAGETIKMTCDVLNTGDRAGAEVVQVYIGKPESEVERATKELRGFHKIQLGAKASQTVSIEIPVDKLAYYDESISGWNLEAGEYVIYIGNASDNIVQEVKVRVR
ncbi:MAG: fibronectin type III-like domain-contianing protein, partial [Bacteroidota bacterium]